MSGLVIELSFVKELLLVVSYSEGLAGFIYEYLELLYFACVTEHG